MIVLTGNSLNKRHQEFNTKVNEAAGSNVNFEEIKDTSERSDIDKLFKIDLASKYKNIDYILEVLKSGDSLYISRALKCDWILDNEFSKLINPSYLERNVFPFMSRKMKHKLLATISTRLRNGERAEEFHHYCMQNLMYNHGMNFLLFTNESFKIEILKLHPQVYNDFNRNEKYVEHFVGNSFLLAEHYLKVANDSSGVLYKLRYLYSVSQEQYLDLLEAFKSTGQYFKSNLRLARDIMKKHRNRVLKDPCFYLSILNKHVVTQYSTIDDAKVYAIAYLPNKFSSFWGKYYNKEAHFFLKLIPIDERLSFLKKIFSEKYPGKKFEMDYNFYTYNYYELMTVREKEDWALRHVASEEELHGCGNDYIWYKFVNFEKAFIELKKYILITPDNDKRLNILYVLIDVAKTQQEIAVLLEYYYTRHINEMKINKRNFLNKLIGYSHNKVFNYNDECWTALEKILYSLDVYNELNKDSNDNQNNPYRVMSLIYYIIHEKSIPEVFYEFVIRGFIKIVDIWYRYNHHLDLNVFDRIFQYMLRCYTNHVESLIQSKPDEANNNIFTILDLILTFGKKVEDIPENIYDQIMLNFEKFETHNLFVKVIHKEPSPSPTPSPPEFHVRDLMHYLKEDASLVISQFPAIKEYFEKKVCRQPKRNINWLIRKLKIYFSHDIAPEYIKLLDECLSVEKLHLHTARVAVFGILNLSDAEYKIDFLKKYVPIDAKIDHVKISLNLLTVQMAICSIACHSRPPLPLSSFRDYIKGDYLQYCVPVFNSYLANLTPDQCLSFVESLLDSPVSVQKHSLRLAFLCFSAENLKLQVLKSWKKTKNVSMRHLIYKTLFNKINNYHENSIAQWELFGALQIMTYDLKQDDDPEIFALLVQMLPPNVYGDHLQSAFTVISTFPKKLINFQRLTGILEAIERNITLISKTFLLAIIEDHVNTMFDQKLRVVENDLVRVKWSLVKTAIINQKDTQVLHLVMDKCLNRWYETKGDAPYSEYIYRRFWTEFLYDLERLSEQENTNHYLETNHIFRTVLTDMENALPLKEIYSLVWQLKVNILTRQVLGENVPIIEKSEQETANILVKETIQKFSRLIGSLMMEHINNNKFFPTFYNAIQDVISKGINKVYTNLSHFIVDEVNDTDISVLLCSVLLEFNIREIQIFVLNFLPKDYERNDTFSTEYLDVIEKLKYSDDEEIQYYMCDKFYSSDYRYRDFMP